MSSLRSLYRICEKLAVFLFSSVSCLVVFDSATPWTVAHQAPLSLGFPRQDYWSGLPFPPSGDLPDPGMELRSPVLAGEFFTTEWGRPLLPLVRYKLRFFGCKYYKPKQTALSKREAYRKDMRTLSNIEGMLNNPTLWSLSDIRSSETISSGGRARPTGWISSRFFLPFFIQLSSRFTFLKKRLWSAQFVTGLFLSQVGKGQCDWQSQQTREQERHSSPKENHASVTKRKGCCSEQAETDVH